VLQRVRAAGSELIEEQEIFRRLSVLPESGRLISDILLDSHLAQVVDPIPERRPDRSVRNPGSPIVGYINSNADGDDGGPLTDYDVIGSATNATGLFSLRAAARFNPNRPPFRLRALKLRPGARSRSAPWAAPAARRAGR